jgi:hypothetical protein
MSGSIAAAGAKALAEEGLQGIIRHLSAGVYKFNVRGVASPGRAPRSRAAGAERRGRGAIDRSLAPWRTRAPLRSANRRRGAPRERPARRRRCACPPPPPPPARRHRAPAAAAAAGFPRPLRREPHKAAVPPALALAVVQRPRLATPRPRTQPAPRTTPPPPKGCVHHARRGQLALGQPGAQVPGHGVRWGGGGEKWRGDAWWRGGRPR